jgi:asparagine synthase (glutamine-hydrolysing)
MCSISGFIDLKKESSEEIMARMSDTMIHRGPDGSGVLVLNEDLAQLGFGHRRLAIIDLSEHGRQPMQYQQYTICFNGEIYNYQEIKDELAGLGHTFVGHSDTEMILHAFSEWGQACIEKFRGMFAIVLFDSVTKEVICIRDRAGVKPFFYYFEDGLFLFSSELKAFHQHPRFKKTLNIHAVAAFLQYGNIPAPHCIFDNCYKLPPASILTFNLNTLQNGLPEPQAYWSVYDAYNKPKSTLSFEEAKAETKKQIAEACELRMVADVPVGVFLSGGYDSSCVAALLQSNRNEKLKTFTISVPDIGLNEAPYAKDTADRLGTDHTEIACTQKEAIDLIPTLPFHYDEPFADSSAIPTTLVSLMARKSVTVALSADGGDELFAGYNRYDYLQRYASKLEKIPNWIRKGIAFGMDKVDADSIPVLKNKYNFHNRYEKMKMILKSYSKENVLLSLSQQFTDEQIQHLPLFKPEILETAYTKSKLQPASFSTLAYAMGIDFETYLPDDILQKVDRATMTASLEGREPLLDHKLVEWAAQLPDNYKYYNGSKKHILKEIVHDFIPKEIMDRPKMGFAIPIGSWLQHELKETVYSYINKDYIQQQGLFEWKEIELLLNKFYGGKKEYDVKIWYLLMFQMWYHKWMA